MKQCPKCGTTYTDPSLSYCLADGSELSAAFEQPTLAGSGADNARIRVDIPEHFAEVQHNAQGAVQPSGSSGLKIFLIIGLVVVMFIGAAVIAGALIYFNKDARLSNKDPAVDVPAANTNSKPVDRSTPVSGETDKLRQQIANLEKRLDEQKAAPASRSDVPAPPDQPSTSFSSPVVNSPADGFLALRSLPSIDVGDRIMKIPNGARVSISGCLPRTRVGNKAGRWCKATYNGYSGWLFDAWLIY